MTTTLAASTELVATESLTSESAVQFIFESASGGLPGQFFLQNCSEAPTLTILAGDTQRPEAPTARQRWLRMAERARQRMASGPTYPDHPDDLAEQEAVTRAFAARQARVQSES
jgi:hypothetical protein